jgi:hypothetical protein
MAEAGLSMEVIAQYLGHEDVNVTRKVYAHFSPRYLKQAGASRPMNLKITTPLQDIEEMVAHAV